MLSRVTGASVKCPNKKSLIQGIDNIALDIEVRIGLKLGGIFWTFL